MKIAFEKNEIVVRIPFDAKAKDRYPLSKSGKSRLVDTTGSFKPVPGAPDPSLQLSVNVICK